MCTLVHTEMLTARTFAVCWPRTEVVSCFVFQTELEHQVEPVAYSSCAGSGKLVCRPFGLGLGFSVSGTPPPVAGSHQLPLPVEYFSWSAGGLARLLLTKEHPCCCLRIGKILGSELCPTPPTVVVCQERKEEGVAHQRRAARYIGATGTSTIDRSLVEAPLLLDLRR